jgi:hypothetical protein
VEKLGLSPSLWRNPLHLWLWIKRYGGSIPTRAKSKVKLFALSIFTDKIALPVVQSCY